MEETLQKPRKRPVARAIERQYGKPLRELILEALESGQSLRTLAKEWDVQASTVLRWANALGFRQAWLVDDREVVATR